MFLVLPRVAGDFLSRELIYTGLTRAQRQLTLYIEKDVSTLLPFESMPRRRRLVAGHGCLASISQGSGDITRND